MTAGKGIIHSELPTEKMMQEGGLMHGFQIWVNLPCQRQNDGTKISRYYGSESPIAQSDGVWQFQLELLLASVLI